MMEPLPSDVELLRRYAATGAHADLTVLVHRYVDLVYSAARRQLRDAHAAQDVTQQVFVILFRKRRDLRPDTILPSWLLKVTSLECRTAMRTRSRRLRRERKVAQMTPEDASHSASPANSPSQASDWDELAPHLDSAMNELSAGDRQAVVLRYFLNRSYASRFRPPSRAIQSNYRLALSPANSHDPPELTTSPKTCARPKRS
jgi:RNA polymerase sigma factor (sigma-70 family)